jgi:hypothetical protein
MRADGSVVRLEVLSDRRKVAAALFIHDILYDRIKSVYLAGLLRFENTAQPARRNVRLIDFYQCIKIWPK